jgi:S-DNA-T family DNA segregation ATPase FtsK/SpoIIIE
VIPGNILMKMMPVVMIVMSLGMMVFMFMSNQKNPTALVMGGMMVMSTVGMMAGGGGGGQGAGAAKAEMHEDRKDYLRYLSQMRERARGSRDEQVQHTEWIHPDPKILSTVVGSRRMWERRMKDGDFMEVRSGHGMQRMDARMVPPQTGPVEELEPITTLALRRFVKAHAVIPDIPLLMTMKGFSTLGLTGQRRKDFARSLITQCATFHSPQDLTIALVSSGNNKREWEWLKWLPHTQHPSKVDGLGPIRCMVPSLAELEGLLAEELGGRIRWVRGQSLATSERRHIIIVFDGGILTREEMLIIEGGLVGVTLIDVSGQLNEMALKRGLKIQVEEDGLHSENKGDNADLVFGQPDFISVAEAEALARRMSPYRLSSSQDVAVTEGSGDNPEGEAKMNANHEMLDLLNIPGNPLTFDVEQAWKPRPVRDRYKVPIGYGKEGQLVEIDIKEAAEGGYGPHGLCVGATGSGKSEFLRTLVLGMLCTHSSVQLNLILVDFKGGATFNGFEESPHVASVITNLAGDLTMVDRMAEAIVGEVERRQEVLAKANAKNAWEYQKRYELGEDLDPLPALFIVIDEFSEMLTVKPDFIDLFLQIGRVGRSLQVHMLLASQRLEEGKLRGLDTFLSYRIGLKTFNAAESRIAIGVSDAYELPPIPGSGFLKTDPNAPLVQFKAAYVSGAWRESEDAPIVTSYERATPSADKRVREFIPEFVPLPEVPKDVPKPIAAPTGPRKLTKEEEAALPTQLGLLIKRFEGHGIPPHQVWLPPLNIPPSMDVMVPPLAPTEDRGLSATGFFNNGRLIVPLGLVDKPRMQMQDTMWADFSGGAGHGVVVGGPQSGKSNFLRTLVMSFALTHTPLEVQFYGLDFGGGGLAQLEGLPHVGGVAGRLDPDKARRMVAELKAVVTDRELRFRDNGIDSMAEYRRRKARGAMADDKFGDVFLIVDGWSNFKTEFENIEMDVVNLAAQGLSYGVHVIVAANRWGEMRPQLKDLLGTKIEFRLGDPAESEMDRRAAENVPQNRPGRGLTPDCLHFLVALPRIDGKGDPDTVGAGMADAVAKVAGAWRGPQAPQVRMLPELLPYKELLAQVPPKDPTKRSRAVPIGINEESLSPVLLDFDADAHFVAFADSEMGKTALLRSIITGITNQYTSQEAKILLVDYRRTLLGVLPKDYEIRYVVSANQLTTLAKELRGTLESRLPGPDVTQTQLRERSWWKGAEVFIVVDDYDLVATQTGNPLQPLSDFLAQAKDVGLHMIVTRRSGGASRSTFDPIIGKLKEISAPGLVMSGSKDEGVLWGTVKPSAMPPGRGTLVSRKAGQQLMHIAWIPSE